MNSLWKAARACLPFGLVALLGCDGSSDRGPVQPTAGGSPSGNGPGGTGGTNTTLSPGANPAGVDDERVVLRRLNRTEYNNTVRDLLGTALRPADTWPGDDISVEGFDTLGLILNFTLRHGDQIERAAWQLVAELLARAETDAARARVLVCTPSQANADECTRQILTSFMKRAYRRPAAVTEIDDLVALAAEIRTKGGSALEGLSAALSAVLMSPHFVYRVELDPNPLSVEAHPLTDHELASRLSYFAWSTMPDEALTLAADAGKLTADPEELDRQVTRLLDDPQSDTLLKNLSAQWLSMRSVDEVAPDAEAFPDFDEALRVGMRQETERFFTSLVREAMPLQTLLLADFSFVDARLAEHYGLNVAPAQMQRVSLGGLPRLGLLTQASFLATTSYPERTSPVKRGSWVIEHLLCTPPPSPPPGVNTSLSAPAPAEALTLRQKLEQHRADPGCAACHALFDPIGFGLENYDAVGGYRTMDNGQPVDAAGTMIDGKAFVGAAEMARLVAADPRFEPCMAEKLLTYGVGRAFSSANAKAYTEQVAATVKEHGGTFRNLLTAVASSEAFRTRRGEAL